MSTPLVSVLIPVYNAGEYLQEAVLSIVNQSYPHLEIIIIDDGSTDGCIETINTINDARIKLIRQKNKGIATTLNRALEEAQGEYFIIQDADDKSYLQRIEKQLECMLGHFELAAVYSGHDLILNNQHFAPSFEYIGVKKCRQLIALFKIPAHDASGMYRLSLIGNMRFDESLFIEQSIDYILRVGENFSMMCLGQCLYSYRINYNSTTRQDINKNNSSINAVRQKACQRRKLAVNDFKMPLQKTALFFKHRHADSHIIPHCMESVVQLKGRQNLSEAFHVSWQCCRLHPLDPYYYKPLLYVIIPLRFIKKYRQVKQWILYKKYNLNKG